MATADPIDLQSAKRKAGTFLKEKVCSIIDKPMNLAYRQPLPDNEEQTAFYVFNSSDGKGYVIVSGDDRTEQVLGYSPTGHIDPEAMPDNMKYYLSELAKELASIDNDVTVISRKSKRRVPVKKAIEPLITTHWGQDSPFNNMAPYVINSKGDTVRCVTGCVATAMAQVMNFYKYPNATIADLPGYTSSSSGFKIDTIPAGATIDWSNMADTYDKNSTPAQCDAVAKLMYLCGVSVKMNYGVSSSGASLSEYTLIKYFGYEKHARYIEKKNYSSLAWFNLIYNELAEGYPMYSDGGNHAYVIDGYDGDNMFHFNWGWGPGSDGYYLLSSVSEYYPDGTTGSTTSYTSGQGVIIGLRTVADGNSSSKSTVKLTQCINDSTLEVHILHPRQLAEECAYGIGYMKDDQSVVPLNVCYEDWPYYENATIGSTQPFIIRGLSKGNYRVVAIKKNEGSTVWKAAEDSELTFADVNVNDDGTMTTQMYGYTTDVKVDTMYFVLDPTFGSNQLKAYVTKNVSDGKTFEGDIALFSIKETKSGTYTLTSYHRLDTKSVILQDNETKCLDMKAFLSGTYYGASDVDSLYTFRFCQGDFNGRKIGDFQVLVKKSAKISKNLAMTMSPTIESFNTAQNYLYGKSLKMKVKIVNENDSDYVGNVEAKVTIGNRSSSSTKGISLKAGDQTEVEFDISPYYTPNDYGTTCKLELKNWCWNGVLSFDRTERSTFEPLVFTLRPGIEVFYDDGTSKCFEASSSFSAPKNATAIDIRKQNILTNLTLANPNCLVFTDDYSGIPSGVTTNIVKSGKSDNITLTDGYSFATPEKFTATNISYTRTFTKGYRADGTGWTTICLPFDVESVKVKNGSTTTAIDWFHSNTDTGKSFWVREFSADNAPTMRFSPADKMIAKHPYIISFPDANSGIGQTLIGKPVTFQGSNAVITPAFRSQTLGYTYRLTGVTSSKTVNLGFGLNDGDTLFIKKSPLSVQAFRAYFDPVTTGAKTRTRLIIAGESEEIGNDTPEQEEKMELVDLGLSVKWANKNIGAMTVERPGYFLSWGELNPKIDYLFDSYEFYDQSIRSYQNIGTDISATQYDAAYSHLGDKYRMPTKAEMQELIDRCTITNETLNGVDGFRITGPNGNSIFMPASGYKYVEAVKFTSDNSQNKKCGFYWTSEAYNNSSLYAHSLTMGTDGSRTVTRFRREYGLTIRPVENRSTILGDLNHDGFVNITDVVLLVNYILGTDEGVVIESEADINGDTSVNITDVVALTNIILGQ